MTTINELNNIHSNQSWSEVENSGMIEIISNYNLAKVLTALYKTGLVNKLKVEEPIKVVQVSKCCF